MTTMSHPLLPAELLGHTVDHLHDTRDALKSCCLVSASWVTRTRRHLFANVAFRSEKRPTIMKKYVSRSLQVPACYTDHLAVSCLKEVTPADAEECGWIPTFLRVARSDVDISGPEISLLQFYGFSPSLRSLQICYNNSPSPRILNLIHLFPLIEDLSLVTCDDDPVEDFDGPHAAVRPPLTGCPKLYAWEGIDYLPDFFPRETASTSGNWIWSWLWQYRYWQYRYW